MFYYTARPQLHGVVKCFFMFYNVPSLEGSLSATVAYSGAQNVEYGPWQVTEDPAPPPSTDPEPPPPTPDGGDTTGP